MKWDKQTSITDKSLNSISYGNGKYIAVGASDTILESNDGINWDVLDKLQEYTIWNKICYAQNKFVVIGSTGNVAIMKDSENTFKLYDTGFTSGVRDFCYGKNKFVAIGTKSFRVSEDAINWTNIELENQFNKICYGENKFIAVGNNDIIAISSDGIDWEFKNTGFSRSLTGIAYGNGTFIATTFGTTDSLIIKSDDGIHWKKAGSYYSSFVSYCGGIFFIRDYISNDGINWIDNTISSISSVTYGNKKFIAVDSSGNIYTANSDLQPINWKKITTETTEELTNCLITNNKYLSIGALNGLIFSSTDGTSFTSNNSGTSNIQYSLAYGNGIYVLVGQNGMILTSNNLETWTHRTSGTTNFLFNVKFIKDKFIAVGTNVILISKDGINWDKKNSDIDIWNIYYKNNKYLICGSKNNTAVISISEDLELWDNFTLNQTSIIKDIAYGNGKYIAVGISYETGCKVYSSLDGINWDLIADNFTTNLNSIIYDDTKFVTVGSNGTTGEVFYSLDGINWEEQYIPVVNDSSLNSIYYYDRKYIMCGRSGTLFTAIKYLNDSGVFLSKNNEYKFYELYISQNGEYKKCEAYISNNNEYKKCGK